MNCRAATCLRWLPAVLLLGPAASGSQRSIGEQPVLQEHLDHDEIAAGRHGFAELFRHGRKIFAAKFNTLDGQGRPASTGAGVPTRRDPANNPGFLRTSGVDANSCAGCHNEPRVGGAGDFVANVFVMAQGADPVTFDTRMGNERNTLGMFGAGAIELLGREMTDDLHAIRQAAVQAAVSSGRSVTRQLLTKGVSFGRITARPDRTLDTSAVEGVDTDLVVKPFHQKGVVRSLREFTVNAMNHHHGMQPVERFGLERTGTDDFDEDGVRDELTLGDITAATIFQAAMAVPVQVLPQDPVQRAAVQQGERLFRSAGCASCHKPFLELESPLYCEPYGRNLKGTFAEADRAYCFDLTQAGETPLLKRGRDGKIRVRAFTDLKRHVICDQDRPHYLENAVQNGVPRDQMLTRKLWDVGSSAPYGHRGDLTTMTEAILAHGGEANESRARFEALPAAQQAKIVEFLKSLQVLEDTEVVDVDP